MPCRPSSVCVFIYMDYTVSGTICGQDRQDETDVVVVGFHSHSPFSELFINVWMKLGFTQMWSVSNERTEDCG